MALEAGSRLGHYDVTSLLGEGGMGQVWQATDTQLNRQVALKILPDAFAADPDRLARFTREAQILASLNHPNIAAIHGIEEAEGTRALVLELVEGPTLADRIAQGPIPLDEALPIAKQIAEALEAAHEAGVIHRDLKPANIKVREDGTVKVLDFGLAKALAGDRGSDPDESPTMTAAATATGVIMGTAEYMSPEQAAGRPVDKRTDIWAFGVVVWEMLTGRRLFTGETVSHVLSAVLRVEPEWDELPGLTPAYMRKLLRRCPEKDRRRRLHDIADARLDLDDGEDGTETTEQAAGQAAPLWWKPIPWVSLAVVAVTVLAFVSGEQGSEPEVTRFAMNLPEGQGAFGVGSGVAVSPDGRTVVYSASDGEFRLYRRDMDALEPVPIRGTEGGRFPFFSPDGESVGFFTGTELSELKRVPLSGGIPVTLAEVRGGFSSGTWLKDDSIVFGSLDRAGPGLSRVPASGGEPFAVASFMEDGEEAAHSYPSAIPAGRGFVSTGWSGDTSWVYLHSPGTGDPVRLVRGRRARVSPSGHLVFERDGTLWAVVFDSEQATVTGEPVPVVESLGSLVNPGGDVSAFALSATGSLAYATAGADAFADRLLFWVNRDGLEEPVDLDPAPYWFPRVSPDGDRIGFHIMAANMDIHVHDLRSGSTSPLTFHQASDGYPVWTPDGEHVVFWSSRETAVMNLFSRPADGTGRVERLTESPNRQAPYSWADRGQLLLFEEQSPDTDTDIWKVSIDGDQTPESVLHEPYAERRPAVSPDGRWIAYQSDESGQWQIWVRPFPDVESGRWPVGTGGITPKWSPDGQELYYRGDNAMMAVRIDTTDGFAPATAVRLFEDRYVIGPVRGNFAGQYAVAPDGRFLMVKELPLTAELIVVRNWAEELRQLLPVD